MKVLYAIFTVIALIGGATVVQADQFFFEDFDGNGHPYTNDTGGDNTLTNVGISAEIGTAPINSEFELVTNVFFIIDERNSLTLMLPKTNIYL